MCWCPTVLGKGTPILSPQGLQRGFMRRFMPRNLFSRSLLIIVVPMVILQAVVTYAILDRESQTITMRLSRGLASNVSMLAAAYDRNAVPESAAKIRTLAQAAFLDVMVEPGKALPETPSQAPDVVIEVFASQFSARIGKAIWLDSETLDDEIDVRVQLDGAVMRVLADRKRAISRNVHIPVVWMAGTAILLLAVAIMFLRNQVRPIEQLADAAEAFGKGRDVPDFRPSGAAEVRRAALAFMDMRQRISRFMQQRTEMLAGVSHDLRTPITRIKLQLAMMPESQDVKDLKSDIGEMERMVDEYLAFARGQAGEGVVDTNISSLLDDITANTRKKEAASGKAKPMDVEIAPDLMIQARPNALKRCVTNLVENALRYGHRAKMTAAERNGVIEIAVEDDGPGIPAERREEAFRPFHRLDEGRNLMAGGVGLGLSIARDIARGHGGDVVLGNSQALGGLRAVVRLPV